MVLTAGATDSSGPLYVLIAVLSGLCLIIGYLSNWLSPFARRHRQRVDKLDDMLDGWAGYPSRPGFDEIPGVPTRLKNMEEKFNERELAQSVLEHNVSEMHRSLNAAHRRLDEFGSTLEREHGETIAMLRQTQHDLTQTRLITNYINLDRFRKEREWIDKLRLQGIETPEPEQELPLTPPPVDSESQ